jgi:hypothetical protein
MEMGWADDLEFWYIPFSIICNPSLSVRTAVRMRVRVTNREWMDATAQMPKPNQTNQTKPDQTRPSEKACHGSQSGTIRDEQ